MGEKAEQAKRLFRSGANCAQSVLVPFAAECGMSEEEAMRLASSFGAGMGRLREVCGALSAAFMVLGVKRGYACLDCKDVKDAHYACIQRFAAAFKDAHGSLLCRDLLGLGEGPDSPISESRTEGYYAERPCEIFIAFAAERLEHELAQPKPLFGFDIRGRQQ